MADQEGISKDQMVDPGIDEKLATTSILHKLETLEECSQLLNLIKQADLGYMLERGDFQTLFAPTNEALASRQIKKEEAESLVSQHLTRGMKRTEDLSSQGNVTVYSGATFTVESNGKGLRVGSAHIVTADLSCVNGVLHVIDGILAG